MRHYEQIVLPIINDGNGSICGRTYDNRCTIAKERGSACWTASKWLDMVTTTVQRLQQNDQMDGAPSPQDVLKAALEVADYYAEHVKELA